MPMPVRTIKRLYRALVPTWVRQSPVAAAAKARLLAHDWIYDAEYYERSVEPAARGSAGTIAATIVGELNPACVIDIGCGTGALLAALRDRGCAVFGLEYAEAAIAVCRGRGLDVKKFDLERDVVDRARTFDVAVSMEVAEHLPERAADRFVDLLTRLSRVVVFTAASPGQGGTDHVNEQTPSYWIAKFRRRGFEHAEEQSQRWRARWTAAGDVESWYRENLMIFRRVAAERPVTD